MGTTPTGVDWCIKALHPSDPQTEVRGIPDHSCVPSLLMNYQSTFTLSPENGATGTWSFVASLLPHPVNFMYIDKTDSTNINIESNFMNTQLAGVTHFDKYTTFVNMAQRWRLAYMSVTCYQDGPELANQGSLVVSQSPVAPRHINFAGPYTNSYGAFPSVENYTVEDRPNFTTSQGMPNAYFARSKEGCYVPLKLTETCQDWVSDAHKVCVSEFYQAIAPAYYRLPENANVAAFPHVNLAPAYYSNQVGLGGEATSPMLNGTWAHISAKNLDVATSFTFFVRCGIEMQVPPSSILSPQLALAPPHDATALDCYFAISRELKDGYPADFNDLGKIWDAISAASKKVLPVIKKIPGFATTGAALTGIVSAGDWLRKTSQGKSQPQNNKKKKKKKGPAQQASGRKENPTRTPRQRKKGKKS